MALDGGISSLRIVVGNGLYRNVEFTVTAQDEETCLLPLRPCLHRDLA
jgi:hypothetical protein